MQKELTLLLDTFIAWNSIEPIVINDDMLLDCINYLNKSELSYDTNLNEYIIPNLLIYETDEKNFKVELAREIIEKSSIRSSFDFNIIVIKEIDEMTIQASNSLLKLFEDIPDRLIIILTTYAKENILETIRSRVLFFWNNEKKIFIEDSIKILINDYYNWKIWWLLSYLINDKISKDQYIWMLWYILENFSDKVNITKTLDAIWNINSTNANAKYIFDEIILG